MTAFERHDAEAADHHADAVWTLYDAVFGDTADQASWRAVGDAWVGGHLEVVELATAPAARGQGIGGRLLDLLVADRGQRVALLSTSADETDPAVRLYRSRGWTTVAAAGRGRPGDGAARRPGRTGGSAS